eukprot:6188928-Karenia_brevis.AAC.1
MERPGGVRATGGWRSGQQGGEIGGKEISIGQRWVRRGRDHGIEQIGGGSQCVRGIPGSQTTSWVGNAGASKEAVRVG